MVDALPGEMLNAILAAGLPGTGTKAVSGEAFVSDFVRAYEDSAGHQRSEALRKFQSATNP